MTSLPDGPLKMLQDYGYSSGEEVFYLAQALGPELTELLGISSFAVQNGLAGNISQIPQTEADELQSLDLKLGVPINLVPPVPIPISMAPVLAAAPAQVNHISHMPAVRAQGDRGTCVAHATVAVLEHALKMDGADAELSEQFLYWDCKQTDGIPTQSGTWLRIAFPLIQRDGTCPEDVWPYQPTPGATEDGGPPPPNAFPMSLMYRRAVQALAPTSVADIKGKLAAGRCVAFSVPVFRSWFRSTQVRADGKINMPLPGDILEGGHAMCLVGYADSDDPGIGGGRFLLRNSWGETWAPACPYGKGYGSIPYAYIARYCTEAYSLP